MTFELSAEQLASVAKANKTGREMVIPHIATLRKVCDQFEAGLLTVPEFAVEVAMVNPDLMDAARAYDAELMGVEPV